MPDSSPVRPVTPGLDASPPARPPDRLADWVAASCERHGVPVKVTDAGVIASVTALMGGRGAALGNGAPAPAPARRPADSETPHGIYPVPVQRTGPDGTGSDVGMVQDGDDDGVLPGQGELGPLTA